MPEAGLLHARVRTIDAPLDLLAVARGCDPALPLFLWEHPARGEAMLAVGVAREIVTRGPDRFATASASARRILDAIDGDATARATLRVVGGFAFSDETSEPAWPALRLVLPRLLWIRAGGRTTLTEIRDDGDTPSETTVDAAPWAPAADTLRLHAGPVDPASRARWAERVDRVRARIADGTLTKAVLARRRRLVADAPIDPAMLVARARATRPTCFNVWMRERGGTSLVASTPELLVRRAGDAVVASALAGSAARGRDADADARAGEALLACPKNAHEHAIVVDAVRTALATVADDVTASASPALLSLPEVHHLATVVTGRLRAPASVFDVGGVLHPTPAVCGTPRAPARTLIEEEEPERGWYTGALGWMDHAGDGALAVVLRSALVAERELTLWAGAGIVAGSDADAELAETEAKMRALVAPFLGPPRATPATTRDPEPDASATMAGAS